MVSAVVQLDGFEAIADIVEAMKGQLDDFRPLWFLIATDFYKDEKRIFSLKGPGQYEDLKKSTKDQKARDYGFIYPILKAEGDLEDSLTNPGNALAIRVLNKKSMRIGTAIPYAVFHHEGTKKMARRPLWETDAGSPLGKRWTDTAEAYFEKVLGTAINNPRRKSRSF